MARLRPLLTHLIALFLCLQWATGAAHCLRALGQEAAQRVEICSAGGIHTILLDDEGKPVQPGTAAHGDACPACPAVAALEPPAPSLPAVAVAYAPFLPPQPAGLPPTPARAPPQQPRAPPLA